MLDNINSREFNIYNLSFDMSFFIWTESSVTIDMHGAGAPGWCSRVRGSFPGLGGLEKNKHVSSPSTYKAQYCGEPS